ncbi:hypothetical protein [Acetobacter okinawensis]|uniref:hypothetical protein n=1 Tax=Acetobacter okinawensis TaxID=1076594 RepID=UPI000A9F66B3|nr:hypothetical protein [Acetobacter okinawensis]
MAVLLCAYGILVPALSWPLIGMVWAYVLVWMVVMDGVKLLYNAAMTRREKNSTALTRPIAQS